MKTNPGFEFVGVFLQDNYYSYVPYHGVNNIALTRVCLNYI